MLRSAAVLGRSDVRPCDRSCLIPGPFSPRSLLRPRTGALRTGDESFRRLRKFSSELQEGRNMEAERSSLPLHFSAPIFLPLSVAGPTSPSSLGVLGRTSVGLRLRRARCFVVPTAPFRLKQFQDRRPAAIFHGMRGRASDLRSRTLGGAGSFGVRRRVTAFSSPATARGASAHIAGDGRLDACPPAPARIARGKGETSHRTP
jgi:hypothetical protein